MKIIFDVGNLLKNYNIFYFFIKNPKKKIQKYLLSAKNNKSSSHSLFVANACDASYLYLGS